TLVGHLGRRAHVVALDAGVLLLEPLADGGRRLRVVVRRVPGELLFFLGRRVDLLLALEGVCGRRGGEHGDEDQRGQLPHRETSWAGCRAHCATGRGIIGPLWTSAAIFRTR